MAEAYPSPTIGTQRRGRSTRWLHLAWLWQAVLGVASFVLAASLWFRPSMLDVPEVLRIALVFLLLLAGSASLLVVPLIFRRDHRGRVIALILNYLAFLALLFYDLHHLNVFVGIDNLADRFPEGLPFLALVVVGWLIAGFAERYAHQPAQARLVQRIGYALMLIAGVVTLIAIGLVPGVLALLRGIFTSPLTLAITVLTAFFGIATWLWWHTRTAATFNATISQSEMLNGYLLLSPNLLGFLIFFAGPLLFSLYVSLTEWSAFGDPEWVGFANYLELLSFDVATLSSASQRASEVLAPRYVELNRFSVFGEHFIIGAKDKLFWIALGNTFFFTLMVVPLSVVPALVLANILNSKMPGMRFFRAVYFLPSVAAVVGVAVIWNWLYNSTVGYINFGITNLVNLLNEVPGVALTDPGIRWLSNADTALPALAIVAAWRIVGFNTVLFLAGLQGISKEIYEAAEVDGAGSWRKFRSITIPLLAPTTFFVLTTTMISTLQVFDEVFVMMNPPAGPNNSTLTAVLYLYQNGFQRFNLGYASAVAWLLFLIIFLATAVQFRVQRAGAGGE